MSFFSSFIFLSFLFFVKVASATVIATELENGTVRLNGNLEGMNVVSQSVGSQSTFTVFSANKKLWRRLQDDWHSSGGGPDSVKSFINSALSKGIILPKVSAESTGILPSVSICANDAGRFIMYCAAGTATFNPFVPPVTCTVTAPGVVDFGPITVGNIDSKKVDAAVECSGITKVQLTIASSTQQSDLKMGDAVVRLTAGPQHSSNIYSWQQTSTLMNIPLGFDLITTGTVAEDKSGSVILSVSII